MKHIRIFLFFSAGVFLLISCSDRKNILSESEDPTIDVNTESASYLRGRSDTYFDWDMVEHLSYRVKSNKFVVGMPWQVGSTLTPYVQQQFLDQNYRNSDPFTRKYSQENGWRLAYSNIGETGELRKYFILYNVYTGVMRFFIYSDFNNNIPPYTGNTQFYLKIEDDTDLLNFVSYPFKAMDSTDKNKYFLYVPLMSVFTPEGVVKGIPFKHEYWYVGELELSYDPNSSYGNDSYLELEIAPYSTVALISDELKNTNTNKLEGIIASGDSDFLSKNINLNSSLNVSAVIPQALVAQYIDRQAQQNQLFFDKLFDDLNLDMIELNGVENGINSILESGIASKSKALSVFFDSYIGTQDQSLNHSLPIDMEVLINSKPSQPRSIWGTIKLPLNLNDREDKRLYSGRLGVWNLSKEPILASTCSLLKNNVDQLIIDFQREFNDLDIILNPDLSTNAVVENKSIVYLYEKPQISKLIEDFELETIEKAIETEINKNYLPTTYFDKSELYRLNTKDNLVQIGLNASMYDQDLMEQVSKLINKLYEDQKVYVQISFDLRNIENNLVHTFSKIYPVSNTFSLVK